MPNLGENKSHPASLKISSLEADSFGDLGQVPHSPKNDVKPTLDELLEVNLGTKDEPIQHSSGKIRPSQKNKYLSPL